MYNANAVVTMQNLKAELEDYKAQLLQFRMRNNDLLAEIEELRREVHQAQTEISCQKSHRESAESGLQQDLDSAIDLTEKQNSLILTLEKQVLYTHMHVSCHCLLTPPPPFFIFLFFLV